MASLDQSGSQQCVFCAKDKDEVNLINLSTSSLAFEDEVILNFDDLFRELLGIKVCLRSPKSKFYQYEV